tara:strand:- start:622 stop:798 length:177 start_codon:yes stop_codon:yes gene_type:complete
VFWGVRGETESCGSGAAVAFKWSLYREDEADLREIIILPPFGWWGSKEQLGMETLNAF